MLRRSAKNKGKRLEKWVIEQILALYPALEPTDVRCTVGSETGSDVKLSTKAIHCFPFSVETKYRETFKTLYSFYDQAASNNYEGCQPLLILKMNNKQPLVVLDAEYFMKVVKNGQK